MPTIQTTRTVTASKAALAAIERAQECAIQIEQLREDLSTMAELRADAIRSALEAGMTQVDVGRLLGISGQAIYHILRQH